MKLTKDKLSALGIHNGHNLASTQPPPRVFIDYLPQELGRITHFAKWQVIEVSKNTDPKAAWYDYGNKTFNCFSPRETKEPQRLAALAWATERYGIAEWERSPFGSYHPKGTLAHLTRTKAP